jgi:hypothetical protein
MKGQILQGSSTAQQAFEYLKHAFSSALVLFHEDPTQTLHRRNTHLTSRSMPFCQHGIDHQLHPIAFYSRKCTTAEINYDVSTMSFWPSSLHSRSGTIIFLALNTKSLSIATIQIYNIL